jgi:hypothetical protein
MGAKAASSNGVAAKWPGERRFSSGVSSKDLALLIPSRSIPNNPVHQGTLKADVDASFFAFDPFVSQDLRSFGQEFLIQG